MNIFELIKTLEKTPSTNEKVSILSKYPDPSTLTTYLKYSLNPLVNYYVRKIPEYTSHDIPTLTFVEGMRHIFNNLTTRKFTGHAALNLLANTLASVPTKEAHLLERMVLKDLRCGVNIGLVNKAFKGLINEYPCLLATPYDEKSSKYVTYPAIVQTKEDGGRINAIVDVVKGTVEFFSRNGKEVTIHNEKMVHHLQALAGLHLDFYSKTVFDGELLAVTPQGIADRQTGNGLFTKAIRGTITPQESMLLRIRLWDYVDYEVFSGNKPSTEKYCDKVMELQHALDKLDSTFIEMVTTYHVNNLEEVDKILQEHYDRGLEGVILKDRTLIWEDKRSKKQLKFKAENTADLIVTNWEEGEGKYAGMLGALECETSDGMLIVSVSGFDDNQRQNLKPEDVVGKIIEVKYNSITKNKKNDKYSLFLPRFVQFRDDKYVANKFEELK